MCSERSDLWYVLVTSLGLFKPVLRSANVWSDHAGRTPMQNVNRASVPLQEMCPQKQKNNSVGSSVKCSSVISTTRKQRLNCNWRETEDKGKEFSNSGGVTFISWPKLVRGLEMILQQIAAMFSSVSNSWWFPQSKGTESHFNVV